MTRVHPIPSSWATSYLIETPDALFLVDAGFVNHAPAILARIDALGRHPEDLRLALVTHAHPDHFGGIAATQDRARFDVACHPTHVDVLREGRGICSPGLRAWSKPYMALARRVMPRMTFRGAENVRSIADGESLHGLGLPGRVYHTPGHSDGCVSLVLDDGTAFTGDLIQGPRWRGASPELSAMGQDPGLMLANWSRLLEMGIRRVMPAHGAPHSAEQLRRALDRLRQAA